MTTNGHPQPTPSAWAVAPLHVDKHESLSHHRVGVRRGAIRVEESDLARHLANCRNEAAE